MYIVLTQYVHNLLHARLKNSSRARVSREPGTGPSPVSEDDEAHARIFGRLELPAQALRALLRAVCDDPSDSFDGRKYSVPHLRFHCQMKAFFRVVSPWFSSER